MRVSSQRTAVALVRAITKLSTPHFAGMLGVSVSTIEKLESGNLRLSEKLAAKISFETGVDEDWLWIGTQHPTCIGSKRPFTTRYFHERRLKMKHSQLSACGCGEDAHLGETKSTTLLGETHGYFVYAMCGHVNSGILDPFDSIEMAVQDWNADSSAACRKIKGARTK